MLCRLTHTRAGIVCIKRSGSDPEKLINDHDILYKYRQNIYLIREWVVSVCVGVGGWGGHEIPAERLLHTPVMAQFLMVSFLMCGAQ